MGGGGGGGVHLGTMNVARRTLFDFGTRVASVVVVACLVVPALAVTGAGAQTTAGPQPTLQDIAVRDNLIADQESLLNTYRCLFDVDAHVVPGGCVDGQPAGGRTQPGTFEGTATQRDVEVRDGLIADQEALLNVYRCQFDVDTQLVPGGCGIEPDPTETAQPAANTYIAVSVGAGDGHSCAIRADQTVACWDWEWDRDSDSSVVVGVYAPDGQFTAIATDSGSSCAISVDGTIACWDWNWDRDSGSYVLEEYEGPDGQFTAIATATYGSPCAIRVSGTIACWVGGWDGDSSGYVVMGEYEGPDGQFTAIAGGDNGVCGIRADQTIACWVRRWDGDSGSYVLVDVPDGQFTAIADGQSDSCAIRVDGTIACWDPRWDRDSGSYVLEEVDVPDGQFTAIEVAGGFPGDGVDTNDHSCAIRVDGTIACWYRPGTTYGPALRERYGPEGQFTAISMGHGYSCAIRVDGTIACWVDGREVAGP